MSLPQLGMSLKKVKRGYKKIKNKKIQEEIEDKLYEVACYVNSELANQGEVDDELVYKDFLDEVEE